MQCSIAVCSRAQPQTHLKVVYGNKNPGTGGEPVLLCEALANQMPTYFFISTAEKENRWVGWNEIPNKSRHPWSTLYKG